MKLLYRGEKYLDESFPDYLMRLAYWNGFRDLKTFSKKLKEIYRERYVNNDFGETVKSNLSIGDARDRDFNRLECEHRDLGWFECKYALELILKRHFYSDEMNLSKQTHGKNLYQIDICRHCWKEHPYVRFYWRLYSYEKCHIHEVDLEPVKMASYEPNEERINSLKSSSIRFSLSSYGTIRKFLEIRKTTGCSLKDLAKETANSSDESKLWPKVVSFLESRFQITFQFERIDEVLDVNVLCGLDPLNRLELVIEALVDKGDASEKLVKVVSLIFLNKFRLYQYRVTDFNSWARTQAYSVSPLLEAYMFGVNTNLFYRDSSFHQEVIGPVYFSDLSDRMMCQFIIDSGIFNDQELSDMYTKGKYYSGGWSDPSDSIPKNYRKYRNFIDVVGDNIFDEVPSPRSSLKS